MIDLVEATIAKLQDAASPSAAFKFVAGLLSLQQLTAPPVDRMTAVYVLDQGASYGADNGLLNAVRQTGSEAVRIVLFIKSAKPQGVDAFNPIKAPRDAVIAELLGWQPDAAAGAVLIRSTKLIDVQPIYLAYEMVFARQRFMTA